MYSEGQDICLWVWLIKVCQFLVTGILLVSVPAVDILTSELLGLLTATKIKICPERITI